MAFTSVENNNGLMREGEYEVYVNDCCETETRSGNQCIKFDFVVRSDVDQPYQRKHMFKNFYRDGITGEYPVDKIGKYANALGVPKGDEFDLSDLIGLNCRMVIKHFTGNDGVERDAIFYLKQSEADSYVSSPIPSTPSSDFFMAYDDDNDLPF